MNVFYRQVRLTNRVILPVTFLLVFFTTHAPLLSAQTFDWEVGLTSERTVIRAQGLVASSRPATTVLLVGGLAGPDRSVEQVEAVLAQYSQLFREDRPINLIAIPLANPDQEILQFPPQGNAYAENPVAHALWRWIGVHAPDLILIAGQDHWGFGQAAENQPVAGIGTIPVQPLDPNTEFLDRLGEFYRLAISEARIEIERRVSRTPQELARQLAETYGYDFSNPAYVPGMGLIGRMRAGQLSQVEELLAGYLSGEEIEVNNPSVMAGQLVFAEHAERTGNPASLDLVVGAANLAFDEQGSLREAMPFHNEMSDSVFMAPPLLTKAGKLTGNSRYFDMAVRHVEFMQAMLLRDDGLYRHSPLADVAWSRGNAFPALGLALVLSDFQQTHPAFAELQQAYLSHLQALLPYQDVDGMWREVIDYPGSFAELSSTAMLGIALKRGLDRGWLDEQTFQPALSAAWNAVLKRTSFSGVFIDVCTSTGKQQSLDAYLDRSAIFGRDDRAGGMVMNFANEMAGNL